MRVARVLPRCARVMLFAAAANALRTTRRRAFAAAVVGGGALLSRPARADVPRLGRFERNEGAKEFLGDWDLEVAARAGATGGRLVFLGSGDCQLFDGQGKLLGESAVPWRSLAPGGSSADGSAADAPARGVVRAAAATPRRGVILGL